MRGRSLKLVEMQWKSRPQYKTIPLTAVLLNQIERVDEQPLQFRNDIKAKIKKDVELPSSRYR